MCDLWKLSALWICAALAACGEVVQEPDDRNEDCATKGDEDGNGLEDCGDPACAGMAACQPACGNGRMEGAERCDDGNLASGDGCDANCTVTGCGNNVVTQGETCDDGNAAGGDGCEANCTITLAACVAGQGCTVDLSMCQESQKAPAWQGKTELSGTLVLVFYTSHKGWACETGIPQAWPVETEPGWWCGVVTQRCICSPADGCY